MRITDLLSKESIKLNLSSKTKPDVIDEMVDLVDASGNLNNKAEYKEAILAREELSTTAVGEGIAIPHAKTKAVKKACLAAGITKDGIDYEAFDGSLSNLFFMIAAPDGANNTHLEVLSRLSTILMDEEFKNSLINSTSVDEFLSLIDKKETEKFPEESKEVKTHNEPQNIKENNKYPEVLAVTACPTGIAHTFMAAENLNNKAEEKGITIKVETNGSGGVKNALTKEEIEHAKCIIVAADKKVQMNRFDGKKVIITKVADGIHKADELLDRAIKGDAPVYHADGVSNDSEESTDEKESLGRKFYKDLMNGVSHMLPFVVGGGILIAIAFLLDDYSINPSNFGMNTPVAAFFKTIGGMAFDFMLLILSGYIAMSIGDRPGLVVGFVGGAIAKAGTTFTSFSNPEEVLVSSGFLGALLAGFIGGYIILLLKKVFSFMPKSLEGIRTILIYPVAGVLLIGIIMLLINPFVAAINTGLNNFLFSLSGVNKVILGAILAGMMSVDLGGPVNKAAYTFGTGMLAEGHYEIMAAVMIGGMIAPLAIALIATFFPKKLPKKERQAGLLNYVMGLSFISEGAIPFASADPIRVLPSCVVGSSVAGAMSMAFNCTLMAPHGGIFVLPLIGNWGWYLVSIIVGSIVAMAIMAALKKNVWE